MQSSLCFAFRQMRQSCKINLDSKKALEWAGPMPTIPRFRVSLSTYLH